MGNLGLNLKKIKDLTFSPDGKHFVYVARRNGQEFIVFDGKRGPVFDDVWGLKFSSDGGHFAYCGGFFKAFSGRPQTFVLLDGEPLPDESAFYPVFSPDGRKLFYLSLEKGKVEGEFNLFIIKSGEVYLCTVELPD